MLAKFLGKAKPTKKAFRRTFESPRLTRYPNFHKRRPDLDDPPKSDYFEPIVGCIEPEYEAEPCINPLEHLHSCAPIPVDLLRRALPERFQEMDRQTQANEATLSHQADYWLSTNPH